LTATGIRAGSTPAVVNIHPVVFRGGEFGRVVPGERSQIANEVSMKRLAINWSNRDTVHMVDDPHGPFVLAKEAEAEVAKLKTENERLRHLLNLTTIGRESGPRILANLIGMLDQEGRKDLDDDEGGGA
jgi:hypothetical protein